MTKVDTLKYIGPLFKERMKENQISTLDALENKLKKMKTIKERRVFMEKILENPRKGTCVGKKIVKGRQYMVQNVNKYAFNSVVSFGKSKEIKMPGFKRTLKTETFFPKKCKLKK